MITLSEVKQGDSIAAITQRLITKFADHPTLLVMVVAIAAFIGLVIGLAIAKLIAAVGSGALLTFLRDVGKAVSIAGVISAIGAAVAGIAGWAARTYGAAVKRGIHDMEDVGRRAAGHYATVNAAGPGVQIGKEGAWKDAAPGMQIGPDEFLKIPRGSQAAVTTIDGAVKDFSATGGISGGTIIPGSWVNTDNSADAQEINQYIKEASDFIVGPTVKTKASGEHI